MQWVFNLAVSIGLFALVGSAPLRADDPTPFRLAVINERAQHPSYTFELYQPLIQELKARLAPAGIAPSLVAAADPTALTKLTREGAADAVMESLFIQSRLTPSFEPWLVPVRKGERAVHSVFFTAPHSDIRTLEDLQGRTLAFESPRSTSAYAIPKAYLKARGLRLVSADSEHPPPDAVRYRFAGDERTQGYWVALGQAEAGVFNNDDWAKLSSGVRLRLRAFARTPPMIRWLLTVRTDLDPALRETIAQTLMELHQDPEGLAAMQKGLISRFDPLTPADRASIAQSRTLLRHLDP